MGEFIVSALYTGLGAAIVGILIGIGITIDDKLDNPPPSDSNETKQD